MLCVDSMKRGLVVILNSLVKPFCSQSNAVQLSRIVNCLTLKFMGKVSNSSIHLPVM